MYSFIFRVIRPFIFKWLEKAIFQIKSLLVKLPWKKEGKDYQLIETADGKMTKFPTYLFEMSESIGAIIGIVGRYCQYLESVDREPLDNQFLQAVMYYDMNYQSTGIWSLDNFIEESIESWLVMHVDGKSDDDKLYFLKQRSARFNIEFPSVKFEKTKK